MIYIAMKPNNVKRLVKDLVLFYLISFAFGGCALAILYIIKPENIIKKSENIIGIYPIRVILISGIIGFIIVNIAFKLVKNRFNLKDMFCNIKIFNNGVEKNIRAIIDTGNFLKDPITNSPVIVVEKEKLEGIIPNEILENVDKIITGEFEISKPEYISKIRLLPFSSLGKQNGMLLGFKVERVELTINNEKIIKDDVIIGIYNKKLSYNEKYECLIGMNYLEER